MQNRPKIKLELTPTDQLLETLGWLALIMLWILTLYNYNSLPKIIPVHFDGAGHTNGFGNKSTLFLLPVIGTIIFVGMTVLNKYPHLFNYPTLITEENAFAQYTNATKMLRYLKLFIILIFLGIVWMTHLTIAGKTNGLGTWFLPVIFGLLFVPTAYFIVKAIQSK